MSPTQRHVVIALAVFLAVAVVLIVWGLGKRDADPPGQTNQQKAERFTPSAFLRQTASPLAVFRPKLKLSQQEFVVDGPARIVTVNVPAQQGGSAERFGTFHLTLGTVATIAYDDNTPDIDPGLKSQTAQLVKTDNDAADDRNTASIIAMREGGQLRLACTSGNLCVFKLD